MKVTEELKNLQKAAKDGQIIFGEKSIKSSVIRNEIDQVFVSKNFEKISLTSVLSTAGVRINTTKMTNYELASHCRKSFPITAVAIKR